MLELSRKKLKTELERIYKTYHSKDFIGTDPIVFLYKYPDPADREIVGLIASSLAYGRVAQIIKSVDKVLAPMKKSPRIFIERSNVPRIQSLFRDFRHRFTGGGDITGMLLGLKKVLAEFGSINRCFMADYNENDETVLPALGLFVKRFFPKGNYMLPDPAMGSACKRLNLYMRWMVRKDIIDPGGWNGVPAAKLVIPLDAHIYRISKNIGFTRRKTADMKTALEITAEFRKICPEDPLKYDFALTRPGIIGSWT